MGESDRAAWAEAVEHALVSGPEVPIPVPASVVLAVEAELPTADDLSGRLVMLALGMAFGMLLGVFLGAVYFGLIAQL